MNSVANTEETKQPVAEEAEFSGTEEKDTEESSSREQRAPEQPEERELSELEKLQADYAALNDKYLRLMAEYDNFRKRSQREKDNIYPDAVASTVGKFLSVLDNFERARAFETQDLEYKKGVELIYAAFLETMEKLHVEAFAEIGEAFQPEIHNAVMHIEDENLGENVISQVFQKGYKIGDKVIRHAMVQVAN